MFRSSSEKMVVSFTVISNIAITILVPINKKGADFLLRVSLNRKVLNVR